MWNAIDADSRVCVQTELLPLLGDCKGTLRGGVCSTDPVRGVISKVRRARITCIIRIWLLCGGSLSVALA